MQSRGAVGSPVITSVLHRILRACPHPTATASEKPIARVLQRVLQRAAIHRQHRPQQNISAIGHILRRGIFFRRVADTVLAGHENHTCRGDLRHILSAPTVDAQSSPRPGQQVVLVTGSTGGLGREVARRLGSMGAFVIVHGRNSERGMEVVEAIENEGVGNARFYAADFSSFDQIREFGEAILRDYDRLDVLVLGGRKPRVSRAGKWQA